MADRKLGRRGLLLSAAALAAGCTPRKPQQGALGLMERWNLRVQREIFSPRRLAPSPRADQSTPYRAFPVYFISETLPLAPIDWRLRVRGLIDRPQDLTLDDLRRMPRTDLRVRHHCVEGWTAVAGWHGVRVADLARIVGARPEAGFIEFRSFDNGYYSSWDRESAEHPQSLLAYGMNGEPLLPAHGAPVRLYSAVKLGYKMTKYLDQVTFLPRMSGGYWEDLGYEWFAGV